MRRGRPEVGDSDGVMTDWSGVGPGGEIGLELRLSNFYEEPVMVNFKGQLDRATRCPESR